MDRQPISQRSEGPTPDALGLKLSGDTTLPQDLRRTQEVEIVVRGTVTSHTFEDKYGKAGNVELTTKYAKVKVDELVEITVLSTPRHMPGQTSMVVDGTDLDEENGVDSPEIVDAQVVGELEAGDPPPGVDKQTGEVEKDKEEVPELDDLDRDPLIPEPAWQELDKQQKHDVAETVARIRALGDALAQTSNPTDTKVATEKIAKLTTALGDDYGLKLNDPADLEEEETTGEAPPPVLSNTGPLPAKTLRARRAFLKAQRSLPAEMKEAREEELAEIARRLEAQDGGNDTAKGAA